MRLTAKTAQDAQKIVPHCSKHHVRCTPARSWVANRRLML
jgi:hypothetical protein